MPLWEDMGTGRNLGGESDRPMQGHDRRRHRTHWAQGFTRETTRFFPRPATPAEVEDALKTLTATWRSEMKKLMLFAIVCAL